ncbi:unnamed protein product, partial [Mesorhabditis spiculigera]
MGKGKKHPVEEYEPQTTEFNYYFNLQRTTFAPHDAVDALYFSTVFANIGVHCYELHRLWTSPYKEDNRAKFIISYMHVTTILLCLTVFLTFERTHTPYDIEVGYVSAWLWGGLILQTTSPCYIVGYFLNCFVFDSHMLMVVFINLMSLFAKAKKAGEYNTGNYEKLCTLIPIYSNLVLFAVNRFGDEETE